MWVCPKCGREFKRTNQGHYCGKAPETVDEYIDSLPEEARGHSSALRSMILKNIPDVKERIAWSMPYFIKDEHSVSFAACKKHISLYADIAVLENFKPQSSEYTIKKNALYLPYDKELPADLIEKIVRQCFIDR